MNKAIKKKVQKNGLYDLTRGAVLGVTPTRP